MACQSHKPPKSWDERSLGRKNSLHQITTNQAFTISGEKVLPITPQRQAVKCDLKSEAQSQNRKPNVGTCGEKEFCQMFSKGQKRIREPARRLASLEKRSRKHTRIGRTLFYRWQLPSHSAPERTQTQCEL